MNHVELMGTLPVQMELRYTADGLPIATLTLAGRQDDRAWYQRATLFGKLGEIIADAPAGTVAYVSGRLRFRSWEAEDGGRRSSLDIIADEVRTLGSDFPTTRDKKGQPILDGGINRALVAGNATRDVEVRQTSSNDVANFGIAVNEYDHRKSESVAHFVDVTAWGGGEAFPIAHDVRKGDGIVVVGPVITSSWEGKDGDRRYRTGVTATRMYPVVKADSPQARKSAGPSDRRLDIDDEFPPEQDLPF